MAQPEPGFYVAPFVIDGSPQGIGFWKLAGLSRRWLALCDRQLQEQASDPSLDGSLGGPLSHLTMRFTAEAGAALATFRVRGRVASSLALVSGASRRAERKVLSLFVESLRRLAAVRATAASAAPFEDVLAIQERPLVIVVPWPVPEITDQDHELVRELALHTAGAFFRSLAPGPR
jgi:hypothetical protein